MEKPTYKPREITPIITIKKRSSIYDDAKKKITE